LVFLSPPQSTFLKKVPSKTSENGSQYKSICKEWYQRPSKDVKHQILVLTCEWIHVMTFRLAKQSFPKFLPSYFFHVSPSTYICSDFSTSNIWLSFLWISLLFKSFTNSFCLE
jgi:hypothetical protein